MKSLRKSFIRQFYKGNGINFVICLAMTMLMSFVSIFLSVVMQQIVDAISGSQNAQPISTVAWMTAALIGSCLIFGGLDAIFSPRFTAKAMDQYKNHVYGCLTKKSVSSFSKENTSTYISALSNDTATIESNYLGSIWKLTEYAIWFFGSFALMLWYSPLLTLVAIGAAALPVVVSVITGGKMAGVEKEVSQHNESFMAVLKDTLSGFSVIKSFKAEKEVSAIFGKITRETENKKGKRNRLQSLINYAGMIAGVAAQMAVFLAGAALSGNDGAVTPGIIIAFINLMGLVVTPISEIPSLIAKRRSAVALIDKIAASLSENIPDSGDDIPPVLNNSIELKNVSFSYEQNKPALSDISISFQAGKSYAIVGGSGSGKSTLLNLLMAAHSNYSGDILFDGKELKTISSPSLYEIVSLIQQNVFVFDNTIRDNITMFRDFPEAEIEKAIALSGLSALIEEKGDSYDCGENGSGLSGGERQRISIARALLRKTPVLLVDEATAALDSETAYTVSDSILGLDGLTRIVVTHSLNETLLSRYDEILVLSNGRLVEQGCFSRLMNNRGYFYSLYTVSQ